MNKKGLILIFLFVVSTIGVVALTNAKNETKWVDVTIEYVPSAYVPELNSRYNDSWEVGVEIDWRLIDNSKVFGQEEKIYFQFFYDCAILTWNLGAFAPGSRPYYGDGFQSNWWLASWNNLTETPSLPLYNETRFGGQLNVMLDDWNLGKTNVDLGDDSGTYQELYIQKNIPLERGWHTLTLFGCELVYDSDHINYEWQYDIDQKTFWVGTDKNDYPEQLFPVRAPYNKVTVTDTPVLSIDLPVAGYNITDIIASNPRPVCEPAADTVVYQEMDIGTATDIKTVDVEAVWNASNTELVIDWNIVGYIWELFVFGVPGLETIYCPSLYNMGPSNVWWVVNDYGVNMTSDTYSLYEGKNYVYCIVAGMKIDDLAVYYTDAVLGEAFRWTGASPAVDIDLATFRIQVGPVESTGISFGIFISVSMLGLVTALYLMRRRK